MSITAHALNVLVPIIERVARVPGLILVAISGAITALSLIVGWAAGTNAQSIVGWWPFAFSVFFAAAVITFAVLRWRLARAVDAKISSLTQSVVSSVDPTGFTSSDSSQDSQHQVINPDGTPVENHEYTFDDEIARFSEKVQNSAAKVPATADRKVFLSSIYNAQRAAISAAGGIDNVPYLRDDLRLTLISAVLSIIAIPFGFFTIFAGVLIWL